MASINNTQTLFSSSNHCIQHEFIQQFIGMLSIIMAGGSYCSLSPRDHEHRLQSFIEQTQNQTLMKNLIKMTFLTHSSLVTKLLNELFQQISSKSTIKLN
ncbi:unnamed protein product [Adineta steineri]|uniref:Uncharacterized protein n=1 Tax=Adineta steineri TaxID=433720 RepID=A0A816ARC1_9BILA|nr:unnamed protein product [Adineta steineri]CAF1598879.1 unnamed protein product [Adineta steineri]